MKKADKKPIKDGETDPEGNVKGFGGKVNGRSKPRYMIAIREDLADRIYAIDPASNWNDRIETLLKEAGR